MDISIVIPAYARQQDGERAIRSARAGGGPWREIVVVDDASPEPFVLPDDLATDERIRVIRHDVNQGEAGARNTGVAHASCDWIAFLDSDDYWASGKLERQAGFAAADQRENPDPLAFYSHGFVQINTVLGRRRALIPVASSNPDDFAGGCWFMPGSTVLFHKQAFAVAGPCDVQLRRLQDLDWFLRLAIKGGKLKVVPFVGAVIEVGPRPSPAAVDAACNALRAKWLTLPDKLSRVQAARLDAYLDLELASAHRYAGNFAGCARLLAKSFWRVPRTGLHLSRWWRKVDVAEIPAPPERPRAS